MNILKIAVLLVRMTGLQFLIMSLVYLSYIPERLHVANMAHSAEFSDRYQFELRMIWLRFGLHVVLGVAIYFLSLPIAKAISEGLIDRSVQTDS